MIVTRHLHSPIVFAQKGQSKIISSDLLQDTVFRRQHSPFIARSRRRRTIQRSQTVPAAALQFSAVPLEAIVAGATGKPPSFSYSVADIIFILLHTQITSITTRVL